MRNKALLGFVAAAMAFGLASAAYGDTAIVSAITDPGGAGTWEVRLRLWGDGGIGTAPASAGLADFIFPNVSVAGTIDSSLNESPMSSFTDGVGTVASGFADYRDNGVNGVGIAAVQPIPYGASPDPRLDQAVMMGVAAADGQWDAPAGSTGATVLWSADTLLASGAYTGTGPVDVATMGTFSFSTLPAGWTGPTGLDALPPVNAVVVQQLTGAGNNGGADGYGAYASALVRVEAGSYTMATNAGNTVSLSLDANTEVILASNQDLAHIDLNTAGAGTHGLDLNSSNPAVSGVTNILTATGVGADAAAQAADRAAMETALYAAILSGDEATSNGVYDRNISLHANSAIGVTDKGGPGQDQLILRTTRMGDFDCNGVVNIDDFTLLATNYLQNDTTWDQGNSNGDNITNIDDFTNLATNYLQPFTPEPATLALLAVGGFGLLARRRRRGA